jgi:hypothetical protein
MAARGWKAQKGSRISITAPMSNPSTIQLQASPCRPYLSLLSMIYLPLVVFVGAASHRKITSSLMRLLTPISSER